MIAFGRFAVLGTFDISTGRLLGQQKVSHSNVVAVLFVCVWLVVVLLWLSSSCSFISIFDYFVAMKIKINMMQNKSNIARIAWIIFSSLFFSHFIHLIYYFMLYTFRIYLSCPVETNTTCMPELTATATSTSTTSNMFV